MMPDKAAPKLTKRVVVRRHPSLEAFAPLGDA